MRIKCIRFAIQEKNPPRVFRPGRKNSGLTLVQARLGGSPEFRGAAPRDHGGLDEGVGEEPLSLPCSPSRVYLGRQMWIGRPSAA